MGPDNGYMLPLFEGADKPIGTYLPQGQASRLPHDSLPISNSPKYPTMIGLIIDGRVHRKGSARKVTHVSSIMDLGSLSLEHL